MAMEIIARLPAAFEKARASGDLLFYSSTVQTYQDTSGLEFHIRICPALLKKPELPSPHFDAVKDAATKLNGRVDPFRPPYNSNLFFGELQGGEGRDYVLLLNKYSVVPEHFLMVTKEHESQQAPLFPPDLIQAYGLISAARMAGRSFFAFYNCGDLSGASQHHKHLQFMPIEEGGPPIEKLARAVRLESPGGCTDRAFTLSSLPYANHVIRLPAGLPFFSPEKQERVLADCFLSLLDLAISTIRHHEEYPAGHPSYNVIITLEHMYVVPRIQENYILGATGDALSVNAVGFAGMLLVKSECELEAVINEGPAKILRGVSLESVHDTQVEGTAAEP